jgi:hypothetical protein
VVPPLDKQEEYSGSSRLSREERRRQSEVVLRRHQAKARVTADSFYGAISLALEVHLGFSPRDDNVTAAFDPLSS